MRGSQPPPRVGNAVKKKNLEMFTKFKMVFTPWCTPANVVVSTVMVKFAETCSHILKQNKNVKDFHYLGEA